MKRKRLKFYNMKPLSMFIIALALTKYKNLEIVFAKKEKFLIKLNFDYRPSDTDHKGFSIYINLFYFEFQFNLYDVRHVEDYDKSQSNTSDIRLLL